MTPSKYQQDIEEIKEAIKDLRSGSQSSDKNNTLLEKLDKAVFGTNGTLGMNAHLARVEEILASYNRAIWIIVGLVATAVVINLINVLVTHWTPK